MEQQITHPVRKLTKRYKFDGDKEEISPEDDAYEDPKLIHNKIKGFIQYFDIYGQPISFNANKEGETVNTTFGGLVSIYIYGFMCFYITYLFKQMFFFENNTIVKNIIDAAAIGDPILYSN
tara:strand:- start:651 stop:1013 length:363 start_codon:yes stop_codon:yes gene_type:complete